MVDSGSARYGDREGGSNYSKGSPRIRCHAGAVSTPHPARERLVALAEPVYEQAIGRQHRKDPVLPRTGGPAGNARLTAWTGLVLLVLFLAELVTALDVRGLMGWHVAIGALLIPPALLKTASTGWRIVRYYRGHDAYRRAGPPPVLLRVLGPLVVVSTLVVLGTGILLILLGPDRSRGGLIDASFLHKGSFVIWAAVTGLHTLARLVPAVQLAFSRKNAPVPGQVSRLAVLLVACMVAAVVAAAVFAGSGAWRSIRLGFHDDFRSPPGTHFVHR